MEQDVQSLDLLDMLESIVSGGKKSMFSNKVSVDREEVMGIIVELRNTMPEETLMANEIYKRSREVLNNANDDAADIAANAKHDADEVLKEAKKEADGIIADARGQADMILQDAEVRRAELIDQDSVAKAAAAKAEQLLNEANATAKQIRVSTKEYVDAELEKLSDFLANEYKAVEQNRREM